MEVGLAVVGHDDSAEFCSLAECEDKAHFHWGRSQVVEELKFEGLCDFFSYFEFEDYHIFHDEVGVKCAYISIPE